MALPLRELAQIYGPRLWLDGSQTAEENAASIGNYPRLAHGMIASAMARISKDARLYFGGKDINALPGGREANESPDTPYAAFFDPNTGNVFIPDVSRHTLPRYRILPVTTPLHELAHLIDYALAGGRGEDDKYSEEPAWGTIYEIFMAGVDETSDEFDKCSTKEERTDLNVAFGYFHGRPWELFADGMSQYFAPADMRNPNWLGPEGFHPSDTMRRSVYKFIDLNVTPLLRAD